MSASAVLRGKHGSRGRYRLGCRCVGCSRSNYKRGEKPEDLRWPIKYLTARHSEELVQDHITQLFGADVTVHDLKAMGLADFDADRLACSLGDHPDNVWPGWIEAGLDYGDPE